MKNLSEALEFFDKRFENAVDPDHSYVGDIDNVKSLLKSTLISLLDEVVVEEKGRFGEDVMIQGWNDGWNSCRQELIKRINEVKK